MAPHRILLGLLQPLLALLLIAGLAQAEPAAFEDDSRTPMIEHSLKALALSVDSAEHMGLQGDCPAEWDGGGPDTALRMPGDQAILDQAYRIRTGRVTYPTASPSHRPCAAPATGPPLV